MRVCVRDKLLFISDSHLLPVILVGDGNVDGEVEKLWEHVFTLMNFYSMRCSFQFTL